MLAPISSLLLRLRALHHFLRAAGRARLPSRVCLRIRRAWGHGCALTPHLPRGSASRVPR